MNEPSQATSLRRFPSDLAVLFGTDLVLFTIGLTGALVAAGVASARSSGDFSLLRLDALRIRIALTPHEGAFCMQAELIDELKARLPSHTELP